MGCDDFVTNVELSGVVKVLGTVDNSYLLCLLHEVHKHNRQLTIKVGSPRLLAQNSMMSSGLIGLSELGDIAPSLGGWHRYTDVDHIAYQIVGELNKSVVNSQKILQLANQHPVMSRMRFIKTLNPFWFGVWLGTVRDPRWYVCRVNPERTSKLERYMGLYVDMQQRVIEAGVAVEKLPVAIRCALTRRCWLPDLESQIHAIDVTDPRNFLFRAFALKSRSDPVKALVRTSQMFTRYARATWLNSLSVGTSHADLMFDPSQFFVQPDEFEAYRVYISAARCESASDDGNR